MLPLDAMDMRILKALQANGSLTVTQVAERVGLSQSPCSRRIQNLTEAGIIKRRVVELDRQILGFDLLVEARIKMQSHDPKLLAAFKAEVQAIPEIQNAMMTLGDFDFRLQLVVKDIGHYQLLLQEKLTSLPGVKEMQSSVVLETIKATTALPL